RIPVDRFRRLGGLVAPAAAVYFRDSRSERAAGCPNGKGDGGVFGLRGVGVSGVQRIRRVGWRSAAWQAGAAAVLASLSAWRAAALAERVGLGGLKGQIIMGTMASSSRGRILFWLVGAVALLLVANALVAVQHTGSRAGQTYRWVCRES